jgi:hypothetical protein
MNLRRSTALCQGWHSDIVGRVAELPISHYANYAIYFVCLAEYLSIYLIINDLYRYYANSAKKYVVSYNPVVASHLV